MNNIKRYVAVILICTFVIFSLVGCGVTNKSKDHNDNLTDCAFTLVSIEDDMRIYKENTTDVMYVAYHLAYCGGLAVMLDTDGTPLLYSEWKERLS